MFYFIYDFSFRDQVGGGGFFLCMYTHSVIVVFPYLELAFYDLCIMVIFISDGVEQVGACVVYYTYRYTVYNFAFSLR